MVTSSRRRARLTRVPRSARAGRHAAPAASAGRADSGSHHTTTVSRRNTAVDGAEVVPAVQFVTLLGALAAWSLGGPWWAGALLAVGAIALGISVVRRRGRSPATAIEPAVPFDVPLPDGGAVGVRIDGDVLVTALRIDAPRPAAAVIGGPDLTGEGPLRLGDLARGLDLFDVSLESIAVMGTAMPPGPPTAVAAYRAVLGPLPAVAVRTTILVLRLRPATCDDAVRRRGGGPAGALRTVAVATRRLGDLLAARGVATTPVDADDLCEATTRLLHGLPFATAVEGPTSGVHCHEGTDALVDPSIFRAAWAAAGATPCVAIDVRGSGSGPTASAVIRHVGSAEHVVGLPIVDPAAGLLSTLPTAARSPARSVPLPDVTVPTMGTGLLIGADDDGRPIAVRLFGPGVDVVTVSVPEVLRLVVLRALAVGATITVRTPDPDRWFSFAAGIGHPAALDVDAPGVAVVAGTDLAVFDAATVEPCPPGTTVLGTSEADADVAIVADKDDPRRIRLRTSSGSIGLWRVAAPEESALCGR